MPSLIDLFEIPIFPISIIRATRVEFRSCRGEFSRVAVSEIVGITYKNAIYMLEAVCKIAVWVFGKGFSAEFKWPCVLRSAWGLSCREIRESSWYKNSPDNFMSRHSKVRDTSPRKFYRNDLLREYGIKN